MERLELDFDNIPPNSTYTVVLIEICGVQLSSKTISSFSWPIYHIDFTLLNLSSDGREFQEAQQELKRQQKQAIREETAAWEEIELDMRIDTLFSLVESE